jgi:hypothetical protein
VLQFLRRHVDQFQWSADDHGFRPLQHRRCVTTLNKPIPRSVSKRKLGVRLVYNLNNEATESYDWSYILILGQLKSNLREDNRSSI